MKMRKNRYEMMTIHIVILRYQIR